MPPLVLLRYDLGGALLYLLAYGLVGYSFSGAISAIAEWFGTLGRALGFVVALVLATYIGWRLWRGYRARKSDTIERVSADELTAMMKRISSSPTSAATATTTSAPNASKAQSGLSRTVFRRRWRGCPAANEFMSIAVAIARRPAS